MRKLVIEIVFDPREVDDAEIIADFRRMMKDSAVENSYSVRLEEIEE